MKAFLIKHPLILLVAITIIIHVAVSVLTYESFNDFSFADENILSVCADIILR